MLKKIWAWLLGTFGKKVHVQLPSAAVVVIKDE
jgi:hypothetical protein